MRKRERERARDSRRESTREIGVGGARKQVGEGKREREKGKEHK